MHIFGDAAVLGPGAGAPAKGDSPALNSLAPPGKPAESVALSAMQHCCFYCSSCAAIISLPHDRLGLMFAGPAIRRVNVRSIATVCSSCRLVAGYSLFRGAYGYDTRHKLASIQPVGATTLVDWLHCTEVSCEYPLPLFVHSEAPLTGEMMQEIAKVWDWDELTCMSGHKILRPAWLYEKKSIAFPTQLAAR
jgi:hypothetical protein